MHTDYKFWYIRRDDEGFITEAAVRFYEGQMERVAGQSVYVRVRQLPVEGRSVFDGQGRSCKLYTPDDFGLIKTDDELKEFLDQELAKDTSRIPVDEQKWRH